MIMKKTLSRSWKLFWIVWAIIAVINIVAAYLWIGFPDAEMGIAA